MHMCVCMCVCARMHPSAGACGGQVPSDPVELKLQGIVGGLKQMGGPLHNSEPLLQTHDLIFTADNYHQA